MFETINYQADSSNINLQIQNLEVDQDHWKSIKYINNFAQDLELILYPHKDFAEKPLIEFLLTFHKGNTRIQELKFFNDENAKHTLICVCISDIATFKPDNWLKRNVIINLKKQHKVLYITEATLEEWLDQDKKLPASWHFQETLSNKYLKYQRLFIA